MPSDIKMPMPKLPDIQAEAEMTGEIDYEDEVYEEEESHYMEEAIASAIGFISAFGLPQPWMSKKAQEYKQAAIDVGLAHNMALVMEKYLPEMEDKPEYALLFSLLTFGAIVIADRKALESKIKPKQKKPDKPKEVRKNDARPKTDEGSSE